jgi:hypothetical protein
MGSAREARAAAMIPSATKSCAAAAVHAAAAKARAAAAPTPAVAHSAASTNLCEQSIVHVRPHRGSWPRENLDGDRLLGQDQARERQRKYRVPEMTSLNHD